MSPKRMGTFRVPQPKKPELPHQVHKGSCAQKEQQQTAQSGAPSHADSDQTRKETGIIGLVYGKIMENHGTSPGNHGLYHGFHHEIWAMWEFSVNLPLNQSNERRLVW